MHAIEGLTDSLIKDKECLRRPRNHRDWRIYENCCLIVSHQAGRA